MTKQAYDKGELMQEITELRRQLNFANKQLHNSNRVGSKKEEKGSIEQSTLAGTLDGFTNEDVIRSFKMCENLQNEKRMLEEQNE